MLPVREQQILDAAKQFIAASLAPVAQQFEQQEGVSPAFIRHMAEAGYLGATIPERYGGLGLSQVAFGLLTEQFGQVCSATRSLLTVHTALVSETILRLGTAQQKAEWLPKLASGEIIAAFALSEASHGSDAQHIQCAWTPCEAGYQLSGKKQWITFGDIADLFVVIASREGKSTAFLVERHQQGLRTERIRGLMAARATYLAQVHLMEVFVPANRVLGHVNMGFEYVVSRALDAGRYNVAWGGLAIAQAALNAMACYAKQRRQFDKPLSHFQLIRGMIADAVTKVHCVRAQCLSAGHLRDQREPAAMIETTIAKYAAAKAAVAITNDALQVHGANGFIEQFRVEYLYREAKVLEVIEGSSQMQQEMISAHGLSVHATL